jgi:hypothetical protein
MTMRELHLEPRPTSILRPALEQVAGAFLAAGEPRVRRTAPSRLELDDGASRVEIEIVGDAEAVEGVLVRHPGGLKAGSAPARLCLEVAEGLDWQAREPGSKAPREPAELLAPGPRHGRDATRALRARLLAVTVLVIVPSAVLWSLGGRRHDAWFFILVLGVFTYFGLRAWGLLAARLRRRR